MEKAIKKRDWRRLIDNDLSTVDGWQGEAPQRLWFRTMFVIHFFSGRRRQGDLQEFLERIPALEGVHLEILSADIIFGTGADFAKKKNQK